ncbi:MAG: O-antigen ligase family protein, partial [Thermoleophilia bacterium]|nr:O-antigen ligase family protein [Thermoleophilia bacterium]MDH3724908.1 O-antigen ligase family protein [Thermoleophilia bacterium]
MRDAGTVLAAIGILLVLFPGVGGRRQQPIALAGLVVLLGAWVLLTLTLLPDSAAGSLRDLLAVPLGAVAGVVAVIICAGLLWLAARLVVAWPWIWFVGMAVALPIRLPITIGGESAKLLIPLYAVIIVGIVAVALMRLTSDEVDVDSPAPLVDVLIGALAAFLVLSELWSVDSDEGAIKIVFFYIPFVLAYLLVIALWRRAPALRILTTTTIAMAVPVALLAVWQYAVRGIFWNDTLIQANVYSRFYRVNSIFFDPNILGRYLVLAVVACIALAWVSRDPRTLWLLAGASITLLAGLFVTFSRSSALMLMVAIAMLAWRAFGARRTVAVAAMLLVLFAGLSFATSKQIRRAATSADRLEQVSEGRFELVRGGVEIWQDHPIRGAGLGSFAELYSTELNTREAIRTRVVISHNAPVTVLSEGGIIAVVLLLAVAAA